MAERFVFALECPECKRRNYHFFRGKKKEYKVELSKFCSQCRKHTAHKQTKAE
ncbi:MAG: 50S ribosomal protein L33 [Elusimicrobia bacterium]|nr:50S ribosomal protein L33 [Elusimicrobiota bacterium]